jgi:hypothetical protein
MAFRRSIHRHITIMFCSPPYTQRYEWRNGFRHGMRNWMLYAVTKAVSCSSTIRLRCVVKRAGDTLKPVDLTTIRLSNQTIDATDWTIGLKPIPIDQHHNWPHHPSHVASDQPLGLTRSQKSNQSHSRWDIEFASFDQSNEAIAFIDYFNTTALNPTTARDIHEPYEPSVCLYSWRQRPFSHQFLIICTSNDNSQMYVLNWSNNQPTMQQYKLLQTTWLYVKDVDALNSRVNDMFRS